MLESVMDFFHEIFYLKADVRVRDKFLMGSPVGVLVIVMSYLLISKYLSRYMKSRKVYFNARMLHSLFNYYVMLFSSYMLYKIVKYMIWSDYNFRCMPLDSGTANESLEMIDAYHKMLLFKLTYSFETIPFILGGHFNLAHVYIVYHHATLPIIVWIATNYYLGGAAVFFGLVNMLTHFIMYGYLFLMSLIPKLRTFNWKALMTFLNVSQMTAILIHGVQLFFDNPCKFPMTMVYIFTAWGISIVIIFIFYVAVLFTKTEKGNSNQFELIDD